MEKTNAMRILEQKKIKYETYEYPHEEGICVDGKTVADLLNQNPMQVFKTLVCVANTKQYFVCVIPVTEEVDLKKAAKVLGVKSLEMIQVKELCPITGYIRGGCSPIGMKKVFKTVVDISALAFDKIIFSGGKIGLQIKMNPKGLENILPLRFDDIVRKDG